MQSLEIQVIAFFFEGFANTDADVWWETGSITKVDPTLAKKYYHLYLRGIVIGGVRCARQLDASPVCGLAKEFSHLSQLNRG